MILVAYRHGQSLSNASHMKIAPKPRGTARLRRYASPAAERDVLDIDRSGSHELLHREMRNGHDDEMAIVQRTGGRPKRCCGNSDGI